MMRMGDLTLQPVAPVPPEIEGYLKKLKRKTRSLSGNWNKRWFFVDPRRREFGYSDNQAGAPRSSIYLDDITAVVQFDDTHFQVESRTRNFFLCGESKASTNCWVTSLEGYRKKLIEFEKDKIAFAAASATASAKASVAAAALCIHFPQQSPPPAAARDLKNKTKKSRDSRDSSDEHQPGHDSFESSSSSSMSSKGSSSSKSKRESRKAEYSTSAQKSEMRSPSPLADSSRGSSNRSKDRSPPASPPSPSDDKRTGDRQRGRDRDRKLERENKRDTSNDRDRSEKIDRERPENSDRDRSRDRNVRAPSGRTTVIQAWVDDF